MARFRRLHVLQTMIDDGLVPVFFHADPERACRIADAVARGGSRILEFTNRGDHAWEVFTSLETYCRKQWPELILGVGSIVDAPTAALYISSGAAFVVSPSLNPEVARLCNRRKVAYCPGCGSVTEIGEAEEMGCEIVKIFPGEEVGGPAFVKSLLAPCPWSCIMPTGGVEPTEESLRAWFGAGVVCVGMGSRLITSALVERGDWDALERRVAETLALIRKVRGRES